jgi:hypothetical protein
MYVYSVCVVLCIDSGLAGGLSPSKESYQLYIDYGTENAAKVQKWAVETQIGRWTITLYSLRWF